MGSPVGYIAPNFYKVKLYSLRVLLSELLIRLAFSPLSLDHNSAELILIRN